MAVQESQLYIPADVQDNLPSMVRNELTRLPAERQEEFVDSYQRKAKSPSTGILLALIGWHYVYLGDWGKQLLFWFTFGGLWVWWIIDLFRVSGMVRDYNRDVATETLRDIKIISG